ncbi:MAG: hypothetical protein LBI06_04780 [Treponema sp.]|jgi:hypothetical protein|nr:hypothetical protein [Treponema sp.]
MSITALKADNLAKLLDGLSLLEDREQNQIISVIDALGFAYEKAAVEMVVDLEAKND